MIVEFLTRALPCTPAPYRGDVFLDTYREDAKNQVEYLEAIVERIVDLQHTSCSIIPSLLVQVVPGQIGIVQSGGSSFMANRSSVFTYHYYSDNSQGMPAGVPLLGIRTLKWKSLPDGSPWPEAGALTEVLH